MKNLHKLLSLLFYWFKNCYYCKRVSCGKSEWQNM